MALGKWVLGSSVLCLTCSMLVAAKDVTPTTAPSTQPVEKKTHARRLTSPWNLLTTLTPEQTTQIEKIHADALEQTKKIDQKEEDDITALLTADQKTELSTALDKAKADRKEHAAKKKRAATTAPSN